MINKLKFILGLIVGALLIPLLFSKSDGMILGFIYGIVWTLFSIDRGWIE